MSQCVQVAEEGEAAEAEVEEEEGLLEVVAEAEVRGAGEGEANRISTTREPTRLTAEPRPRDESLGCGPWLAGWACDLAKDNIHSPRPPLTRDRQTTVGRAAGAERGLVRGGSEGGLTREPEEFAAQAQASCQRQAGPDCGRFL
jgi:hypothetical protein